MKTTLNRCRLPSLPTDPFSPSLTVQKLSSLDLRLLKRYMIWCIIRQHVAVLCAPDVCAYAVLLSVAEDKVYVAIVCLCHISSRVKPARAALRHAMLLHILRTLTKMQQAPHEEVRNQLQHPSLRMVQVHCRILQATSAIDMQTSGSH